MNFVDYLEAHHHVTPVSGGRQLKVSGPCPFCGEDRSDIRLYVNAETGLGDCKHCGTFFGPIKWVMAAESLSARKARALLDDEQEWFRRETGEGRCDTPALVFPETADIEESAEATEYLRRRHIGSEAIKHFGLSYGIADITVPSEATPGTSERIYRTKNRIIIPIKGFDGKIDSWQGRDITGRSKVRYLFPAGFKGAEYLYNSDTITFRPDYMVVCEGVFDALGWWQAGVRNVVATFGKKVSEPQVEILRAINPKVLFMAWDDDAAKQKYEFCERFGHLFDIRIVWLGGNDADELTKGALANALLEAKPYCWSDKILSAIG